MRILTVILAITAGLLAFPAISDESKTDKIERASSAAPSDLSDKATIVDVDGSVLKQGESDWSCMPGIPVVAGDMHPMCNDAVWREFMKAAATGAPFETDRIGISYMLKGDAMVSNSNPAATDPGNGDVWVQEGPHIMVVVPQAVLKGLSDDPYNGGPYVMWKDTPYAHIMVPIVNK
ncbi:hypothetical protein [Neptunomonas antarctica]|uniref:Uncharacterized protein n=1 Tax=Neptunomonas antarctica TaxID=619304 RepID=A0A1N7LLU8_9GAMM|nr:hypothetical protein [Neptunomonas antarctica]SIS74823.1 hypothetical protein SAMN05421760_104144 [Neptunomonas antarctica]